MALKTMNTLAFPPNFVPCLIIFTEALINVKQHSIWPFIEPLLSVHVSTYLIVLCFLLTVSGTLPRTDKIMNTEFEACESSK